MMQILCSQIQQNNYPVLDLKNLHAFFNIFDRMVDITVWRYQQEIKRKATEGLYLG